MIRYDMCCEFDGELSKWKDELGEWVLYSEARAEIDALKAELALAKELLDRWYNDSDIPDSSCSCHISPPCGDCVNWGGLRETASETKKLLGVNNPALKDGALF